MVLTYECPVQGNQDEPLVCVKPLVKIPAQIIVDLDACFFPFGRGPDEERREGGAPGPDRRVRRVDRENGAVKGGEGNRAPIGLGVRHPRM